MVALAPGHPESVGMSSDLLERAAGVLADAIAAGDISAASIVVFRGPHVVLQRGLGRSRPDAQGEAVGPDSVFLLASISKAFAAISLMTLVDRGLVSLLDPVEAYLPGFTPGRRVTVRDLLTHTAGLPLQLPEDQELRRAHAPLSTFVERALTTPLIYEPRSDWSYCNQGVLLAGAIVERLTGLSLREFQRQEIFEPLGMSRSSLGLGGRSIEKTVWCGTELGRKPGSLDGDDATRYDYTANSPYWRDQGHPWGGMHSTAPDLACCLRMMLCGGTYAGCRILSAASARAMVTDQNSHLVRKPWGIGFGLAGSVDWNYFGTLVSSAAFGHSGATGTTFWADPVSDISCVILCNAMVGQGSLLAKVSNAVNASVEMLERPSRHIGAGSSARM